MAGPVILAVGEDPDALRDLDQELNDRYARHYRVRTMGSALAALEWRAELSAAGEEVALILAGQGLPGMTGSDLRLDIHRDQQGFILTGTDLPGNRSWLLERRPFLLETSMPAVFGAGDVRYGSGKRVASAVGEGAVAIQLLHRLFDSESRHSQERRNDRLYLRAD